MTRLNRSPRIEAYYARREAARRHRRDYIAGCVIGLGISFAAIAYGMSLPVPQLPYAPAAQAPSR